MTYLIAAGCGGLLALGFAGVVEWPWIIFVLALLVVALVFRRKKTVRR